MSQTAIDMDALNKTIAEAFKQHARDIIGQEHAFSLGYKIAHTAALSTLKPEGERISGERTEVVDYVSRYGGRCRDCADADGVCPADGTPCDPDVEKAVIKKTLAAIKYGIAHGFIANPFSPTSEQISGEAVERIEALVKKHADVYCIEDEATLESCLRNALTEAIGGRHE